MHGGCLGEAREMEQFGGVGWGRKGCCILSRWKEECIAKNKEYALSLDSEPLSLFCCPEAH